jgi:hypothetical protein
MQPLLSLPGEIGAEFLGAWRHDVERCVDHARRAKRLGPAWAVAEALDFGTHVRIRFEPPFGLPGRPPLTVRVLKVTPQALTKAG